MKKSLHIILVLLFFSSLACTPGWREFESAEGGFKVTVKGKTRQVTDTQVVDGQSYTFHILQTYYPGKRNGMACNVMYVDLKPGSSKNRDSQAEAMLGRFWDAGGEVEVIDSTTVEAAGHQTTQYEYNTEYGRYLMRYVVVDLRLYMITAGCDLEASNLDHLHRFLDSFQLFDE